MRRVFFFLVIGCLVIAAAWTLANLPGHVVATIGSITIETSAAFAIAVLVVFVGLMLLVVRVLGVLAGLPKKGVGWQRQRRLKLGEQAVTRVLVALAAGEQREARREARKARLLLGASPQTLLLIAEAGRLSGREDEAEDAFRALTKIQDARFLGLRGLLRQAIDRGDWDQAEAIAREAEAAHPGTMWLRQQRAELALHTNNWAEAAELTRLDGPSAPYYVAAADAEADPGRALRLAKQAWRENPAFTPAVLAYARRLRSSGHEKGAQAAIAEAWVNTPHPELAHFILAGAADALSRYQLAKRLVAKNPTHLESRLLLAKAAIEAGLAGEARDQVEAARAEGANQRRVWLMIAELDEIERGDSEEGRASQRDALRHAAVAEPDPVWQCAKCHSDHSQWSAKCSTCGAVGEIRWYTSPQTQIIPVSAVA